MTAAYADFLAAKRIAVPPSGFTVDDAHINQKLHRWQRDVVRWALRRGRAAIFEDCGLGKTPQQLEWASQVCRYTGGRVLLLTPCAVAPQTVREAEKFAIATPVKQVRQQSDCIDGINICNYERLHLFNLSGFVGVVPDESSILKSYTGATKRKLVEGFAETPYKLPCTATPAPNDLMELGNHSEFVGAMPSSEMLSVWFINDSMKTGKYRLRKHAEQDFWAWVASWAVCLSTPADLGYPDDGYVLPPLCIKEHVISSHTPAGCLFPTQSISATEVHREKRSALLERAELTARLVNADQDQWVIWCDTDYEADALKTRIREAVEVRGSHSDAFKEDAFLGFTEGRYRNVITKPEIGGFGLNWQHCHKMTWFAGYSYEKFYQAARRLWRFGQLFAVECHLIMTEAEQSIADAAKLKASNHELMKSAMSAAMREFQIENVTGERRQLKTYKPTKSMELPQWLSA